jgi:SpoVK/Ycf46/Vps4 family AAA+-type ATPase
MLCISGWQGEEYSIRQIFQKARMMAPSVLVLEDLDSLINDSNRSFFLNELDGLESNDGILVIGTTNHFDRVDISHNSTLQTLALTLSLLARSRRFKQT